VPGLGLGRDPERTPMQWTAGIHAGFTAGTPWLPVASDAATVNVEVEREDPESMLSFYRSLLSLRRAARALSVGTFSVLELTEDVLGFERTHQGSSFTVLLNFSAQPRRVQVQLPSSAEILLSTSTKRALGPLDSTLTLGGNEGIVVSARRSVAPG